MSTEVIEDSDSDIDSVGEEYGGDGNMEIIDPHEYDPEYLSYSSMRYEEVEIFLNKTVEQLCSTLQITSSVAKAILRAYKWNTEKVMNKYLDNETEVLINSNLVPREPSPIDLSSQRCCGVCTNTPPMNQYSALTCGHYFCNECWAEYFGTQVMQGLSSSIECMAPECQVLALEDFVLPFITDPNMREKYQQSILKDHVKSHPQLRLCPGLDCQLVFHAVDVGGGARRVECRACGLLLCFSCLGPHHAPTDCANIRLWLAKCKEDFLETVKYLIKSTKCCPYCHTNIEKNGGCNYMHCSNCNEDFCWLCLTKCGNYSGCSRYVEGQNMQHERSEKRRALQKYLHYYERWRNHARSLQLEEETTAYLEDRIHNKISAGSGTWINWKYIQEATKMLKRCRYTLQYTYPCAYYMEGPKKVLFEYQQAQLEMEIEKLSWKIERAEQMDRNDIMNQMTIAEKRRITLLRESKSLDFYSASSSS